MWGRKLYSAAACTPMVQFHDALCFVCRKTLPLALLSEIAYAPPYWLHALLWLPLTIALAIGLLQPVKGAIVGWPWANRMHGLDPMRKLRDSRPAMTPRLPNVTGTSLATTFRLGVVGIPYPTDSPIISSGAAYRFATSGQPPSCNGR